MGFFTMVPSLSKAWSKHTAAAALTASTAFGLGWGLGAAPCFAADAPAPTGAPATSKPAEAAPQWKIFVTPQQVQEWAAKDSKLVIVDARSPEEYAAEHVPGAINAPGALWRTPPTKNPGKEGIGQYIFRDGQHRPDVGRYEALLSGFGLDRDQRIVVYGNHAGRADGSVPVSILFWLGQEKAHFLDGIGLNEWKAAGFPTTKEPKTLPKSDFKASPQAGHLWSIDDVLKHIDDKEVVFFDSRSPAEYAGKDLRGVTRGGHIPGAKLLNYEDLLDPKTKKILAPEEVAKKISASGVDKGKTVVIYCQTGTRCSLKELALKELGFEKVVLYDAGWQEYGNRQHSVIVQDGADKAAPAATTPAPTK